MQTKMHFRFLRYFQQTAGFLFMTGGLLFLHTAVANASEVQFVSASYSVTEAAGVVIIQASRTNSAGVEGVRVEVTGGTAQPTVDFLVTTNLLQFQDGASTADYSIYVLDNADPTGDHDIQLTLTPDSTGTTIGATATTVVTILDDDAPGYPGLGLGGYTFLDDGAGTVYAYQPQVLALFRDNQDRLLAGGDFLTVNGLSISNLVRMLPSGDVDSTFQMGTGPDGWIYSIIADSQGRILIGGTFQHYDGHPAGGLARLLPDGSFDSTFVTGAGFDQLVERVESLHDGRILAGGFFQNYQGVPRPGVAVLGDSGALDGTFVPVTGIQQGSYYFSHGAYQSPGGIIVIGASSGGSTNALFRLSSTGTRDPGFVADLGGSGGFSAVVSGVVIQPDGRLVVGGTFSTVSGVPRNNIARLNSDGSIDGTFDPGSGTDDGVFRLFQQSDGKIILVGYFQKYDGVPSPYISRIQSNGARDLTFAPGTGPNFNAYAAVFHTNGTISVGGGFSLFAGFQRGALATINADGTLALTVPKFLSADVSSGKFNLSVNVEPQVDVRLLQSAALNGWSPVVTNRTYKRVLQFATDASAAGNAFYQAERLGP